MAYPTPGPAAGRVMLITGGTSRIGAATARAAVAAGYRVTVTGRDHAGLQAITDELGDVLGVPVDVTDWAAQAGAVQDTLDRFGRLDIAFANAGFRTESDLETGDPPAWREMILANILGGATNWAITALGESARQHLNGTGVRVTVIEPDRVAIPFWSSSPPDSLTAEDIARTVLWALDQPPHVDINEPLLRSTSQNL